MPTIEAPAAPKVKIAATPLPPVFATASEERQHRKQRLAAAFRLFAKFGFSEGVAGHITARDPEQTDCFWVNPFGMHFAHIRASDLVLVNEEGEVIEGNRPINEAAFAIHSRIHMARPDVIAAAHAHSLYGRTWASLGRLLAPITQDACAFYQDCGLFADYTGVVYDTSEGDRIVSAIGQHKAAILQNHGLLTVGQTVDEAAWWFIKMERCCQSQLMAEAAGKPIPIQHESALIAQQQIGNPRVGWFEFQPLWDLITREQPDLRSRSAQANPSRVRQRAEHCKAIHRPLQTACRRLHKFALDPRLGVASSHEVLALFFWIRFGDNDASAAFRASCLQADS